VGSSGVLFALLLRVAQELVETGDAVDDGAVELHERNPARHAQAIERGDADAEPRRGLRRPIGSPASPAPSLKKVFESMRHQPGLRGPPDASGSHPLRASTLDSMIE
jgi:hypothetical protein